MWVAGDLSRFLQLFKRVALHFVPWELRNWLTGLDSIPDNAGLMRSATLTQSMPNLMAVSPNIHPQHAPPQ